MPGRGLRTTEASPRPEARSMAGTPATRLAVFAVLAATVPAAGQELRPEIVERVRPAAVLLRATRPDRSVIHASGFLAVEPDVVITSAHALGVGWAADPLPTGVTAVLDAGTPA